MRWCKPLKTPTNVPNLVKTTAKILGSYLKLRPSKTAVSSTTPRNPVSLSIWLAAKTSALITQASPRTTTRSSSSWTKWPRSSWSSQASTSYTARRGSSKWSVAQSIPSLELACTDYFPVEMDRLLLLDTDPGRHKRASNKYSFSMGALKKDRCWQVSASRRSHVAWYTRDACSMMDQFTSGVHAEIISTFLRRTRSKKRLFANILPKFFLETVSNINKIRIQEAFQGVKCLLRRMNRWVHHLSLKLKWVSSLQSLFQWEVTSIPGVWTTKVSLEMAQRSQPMTHIRFLQLVQLPSTRLKLPPRLLVVWSIA